MGSPASVIVIASSSFACVRKPTTLQDGRNWRKVDKRRGLSARLCFVRDSENERSFRLVGCIEVRTNKRKYMSLFNCLSKLVPKVLNTRLGESS